MGLGSKDVVPRSAIAIDPFCRSRIIRKDKRIIGIIMGG